MKVAPLVVAVIVTSCLASSTADYAEVSDMLSAEDMRGGVAKVPTIIGGPKPSYYKIPFFVLKAGSTKVIKAKKASDCEDACTQRKACKSYSFSVIKQDCLWSKFALMFNGDFSFYSKRTGQGKKISGDSRMSRYRQFFGMMYQDNTWTRYTGPSRAKCQKMCDTASNSENQTCHGYSYRSKDKTCLLSANGLFYDTDYDYYERTSDLKKSKKSGVKRGDAVHSSFKKQMLKKNPPVPTMSKQYKQQLVVQEAAAKQGAKELVHKGRRKKKRKLMKKKLKKLAKKYRGGTKKAKKKAKKAKKKRMKAKKAKKKKKIQKKEVKTMSKFMRMKQKIREAARKEAVRDKKRLAASRKKHHEKLRKELAYKTKKKEEKVKAARARELTSKKIDVLIFRGVHLAAKERKNKASWVHYKEDKVKKRLAMKQAKITLARRHARHRASFKRFVVKTLKRRLKKKKANIAIRVSLVKMMKQKKRVLTATVKRERKFAARVHLISLNIAKLKAKANGLQHVINLKAKRGKKAPATNIKLKYTMNAIKSQQRQKAFKTKKLLRTRRSVRNQKAAIKRLDRKMTKAGAGRRRRAMKSKTSAATPKRQGIKIPTTFPAVKRKKSNPVTTRRRRSKARVFTRYLHNARMNGGAATKLQSVPTLPTSRL